MNMFHTSPKKRVAKEEKIQLQICRYLKLQYPSVTFLCDIVAGLNLGFKWASATKISRSSRGLPDIYIFKKNNLFCGLAIELKSGKGSIYKKDGTLRSQKKQVKRKGIVVGEYDHLQEQDMAHQRLRGEGWKAEFSEGFEQTRKLIDTYLAD